MAYLHKQVVLGRAVFVSLIDERDRVLARRIRAACLQPCLQPCLQEAVAGGEAGGEAGGRAGGEAGGEAGAVVAVIGMAHLAGVREALGRPDI